MGKRTRKNRPARNTLLNDDHLLDELGDLLIAKKAGDSKDEDDSRMESICDEIYDREEERDFRSIEQPIPTFSSREKMLAITEEYGIELFGSVDESVIIAWNIPLSSRYPKDRDEWETDYEENPFTETLEKAEAFEEDILEILEIADNADGYEETHSRKILETIKICASCWDDKKRNGICDSVEHMSRVSIIGADIYSSTWLSDMVAKKLEDEDGEHEFINEDSILFSVSMSHLISRQATLMDEARFMVERGIFDLCADSMFGAMAACAIRIIDGSEVDIDVLDEDELEHYMATKAHAYEVMFLSPGLLLPEKAIETDAYNMATYKSRYLFSGFEDIDPVIE